MTICIFQKAEHKAASGKTVEPTEDSADYSEGKYGPYQMIQVRLLLLDFKMNNCYLNILLF